MGLGGGIFFLILGSILIFAIKPQAKAEVEWIDLTVVGWIFIIAALVGIVLTSSYAKRQKQIHREVHETYQANRIARRQAIKRADATPPAEMPSNASVPRQDSTERPA